MSEFYIGLMSGTSLDGADGVLTDFSGSGVRVLASATRAFAADFRQELLALNSPSDNELHRGALAGNLIAMVYADVVADLLRQAGQQNIKKAQIRAIGAHGQTVRHQPGSNVATRYTLQLNNPGLLAELSGIDVVADLRSRDVAAGGQGAPLVPAFHHHVFNQPEASVAVLNLGGIANLSVLPADASLPVSGFDCGPGNALMDAWCLRHTGQVCDASGNWAAGGQCIPGLLQQLKDEPYFSQNPPKSTGRDLFSQTWLAHKLQNFATARPQDIQTTLTELTASACAESVESYAKDSKLLIVCGGGAFNQYLLQRLQVHLPTHQVSTSERFGLPPMQVEAAAFAWLARQTMHRLPGNLPSVTGAAGPRILGAIYPA
ncbi:MAG: anhydro-N-acetylmuramic acid kinase [Comamonadaceae bacterium]|nr:anhydro-N-acetylmuramic acid kinase [Comamonadaceae bacterium]